MKKYTVVFLGLTFIGLSLWSRPLVARWLLREDPRITGEWARKIIIETQTCRATEDGRSVFEILDQSEFNGSPCVRTIWSIVGSDIFMFNAVVAGIALYENGDSQCLIWQWDSRWPNVLAITPRTAELCPLLDPKCSLSPCGNMILPAGESARQRYFEKSGK